MNTKVMKFIGIILILVLFIVTKLTILSNKSSKELKLTYQTNGGVPYEW